MTENAAQTPRPRHFLYFPWVIVGLAVLFYFYEYWLRISPSVMTREIMSTYHLNARSFGNLVATYYYIYAPCQLVVGVLIDRYGPRWLLTMAALLCSVGIFTFGSSHALWEGESARLLLGFGAAFAFVGVLKLASIWLPNGRFATITGIIVALGMLGGVFGDIIMTHMVQDEGWRLACYIMAAAGLIITLCLFLFVRDKDLVMPTTAPVYFQSFKSLWMDLKELLRNRNIWINASLACLMYIPIAGFVESWEIPFFHDGVGMSYATSAMAAAIAFLGWIIGAPLIGWFSDKIGQRRLPLTIGAIGGAISLSSVIFVPEMGLPILYTMLFLFGFFVSAQMITFPVSLELTSKRLAGTAVALTNMMAMFSGVVIYLVGMLIEARWNGRILGGLNVYSLDNYQLSLFILPAALVLAVFLTFFLKETNCKSKD